jgi:hypothetical protein
MFPQQQFKLNRQAILLAMISAAYPMTGYCVVAGHADFVIGDVVAVAPNGTQRPLAKGALINAGDAINTSANARAQLRFSDGGFVSLQPNTQFRVDEYRYENKTDGNEKSFFSLLRGGLRAITGAIGHINRNTYQVATPSATIGIRGTGYNAMLSDGGLLVNVGEGAISLTNNAGELVVTSGNAAFVADINTAPASTFEKPNTAPTSYITPFVPTPTTLSKLPSMTSGDGYAVAFAYTDGGEGTGVLHPVTTTFSSTSQLTQYDGGEGSTGALGTANVSFSATDGIIGWGRWNGGTTTGDSPHSLDLVNGDTFHYVTGIPTPQADIDAMSNITATYSLIGGTRPTGDGAEGGLGNLNGGSLRAYFGDRTVDANLQISFPAGTGYSAHSYDINATGMNINNNSTFSSGSNVTGGSCGGGCSGNISGFFAGVNAARAGVAYSFSDFNTGNVAGVAAFTKSSSGPDGQVPAQ